MKTSRRNFLKLTGFSALGFGTTTAAMVAPIATWKAQAQIFGLPSNIKFTSNDKELKAKHWAIVIDTRKFEDPVLFNKVIKACHSIHNVPNIVDADDMPTKNQVKWLWTDDYAASFPDNPSHYLPEAVKKRRFLLLCNHCEQPPCVRVCPTKATYKRKSDGVVLMDYHRCIGCRFCMAACPFGARSFNFGDPRAYIAETNPEFPTRMQGVVEKCTFCAERLAIGKLPACVEASGGAIVFGDLENNKSEIRQTLRENFAIRRKPSLGTQPSVYYII
ncbi:4Fe-4S ferredoxin iron-sulfur binding domain protein [Desulfovibrionales bacterium]